MIDKLDLRISRSMELHPDIRQYIRSPFAPDYSSRVHRSRMYSGVADLRPLGRDALLHLDCKFGNHDHKLEIFDVGKKPYSEIVELCASVACADPDRLGVMRIDLTADLPDVPVSWFQMHTRVKHKRFATEHGELKYERFGKGQVETVAAGKRPNLVRIYNKTAECEMQFRKMERQHKRKHGKNAEPLNFEQAFGFPRAAMLTRVERQYGGNRIPEHLRSFSELHRLPETNPFEVIEFMTTDATRLPTIEECSDASEYFTGLGMYHTARDLGMQTFRQLLNKHTNGNAARQLQRYSRFMPSEQGQGLTAQALYEAYRASTVAQLAA